MKRIIILSGALYLLVSPVANAEVSVGINFGYPSEPSYIEEEPAPTYVAPPYYPDYYRYRHYHHWHEEHERREHHEDHREERH